MQGPPRDAIAKKHKQTRLPKPKNPDRYFTRIKNRFIRANNSGNHAVVRANIGPTKTRQSQVLTRVVISQMNNKKTRPEETRGKSQQNDPENPATADVIP